MIPLHHVPFVLHAFDAKDRPRLGKAAWNPVERVDAPYGGGRCGRSAGTVSQRIARPPAFLAVLLCVLVIMFGTPIVRISVPIQGRPTLPGLEV